MYYKNKIDPWLGWSTVYTCGCKIRNNTYRYNIYFGMDEGALAFEGRLIKAIKAGEFGEEYQQLLLDNPDITVDSRISLYKCDNCQHWENSERLDFYRKITSNPKKTMFKYYRHYPHICPQCGNEMREILNSLYVIEQERLTCPKCKQQLTLYNSYNKIKPYASKENEYHKVLLSMIDQSLEIFRDNQFLISRLDPNAVLYVRNDNEDSTVIFGRENVAEELFRIGMQNLEYEPYLWHADTVAVSAKDPTIVSIPSIVKWNIKTAIHAYKGREQEQQGWLISGTISNDALIESLIIIPAEGIDFGVIRRGCENRRI